MSRPIRIVVDSSVRVPKVGKSGKRILSDEISDALKNEFTFPNPEYAKKQYLKIPGWWNEPKEVGTWWETRDALVFPRGCLRKIRDVFEEEKVPYKLRDRRTSGELCVGFPDYIGHDLYGYQEEAIAAMIAKQNCIVRLPTGSGKSLTAIALASRLGLNTIVILPTVGLFDQWCKDAYKSLQIDADDLGIIHRKKRTLRPITAAVQGTLAASGVDDELQEFFGVVIVDECQKAAARTYVEVVNPFPAKYRFGISADERRQDRKDYLTHGLFGGVAYEKSRKELEDANYIVDVEIRVVPTKFEADWYGVSRSGDDEKEIDFKRLVDEMIVDEDRNELALWCAQQELDEDQKVIMLSHRVEHCQRLERSFVHAKIASGFFLGGQENRKQFNATKQGIEDGTIRVGVGTYSALGVGVNLPAIGAGIAVTPISGNKFTVNQVRGRMNRKGEGKQRARLYILWDRHVYPKHLRNLVAWNPTVSIWHKKRWVNAKKYLKSGAL